MIEKFKLSFPDCEAFQNKIAKKKDSTTSVAEFQSESSKNILICDSIMSVDLIDLGLLKTQFHIIQNSIQTLDEKIDFINRVQKNRKNFFEKDFTIFSKNKNIFNMLIDEQMSRDSMISSIFEFLKINKGYSRHQVLYQVINELIMNAQIDAKNVAGRYSNESSFIKIEVGDHYIGFSIIDYYGSLDVKTLLQKISRVQKNGLGNSVNMDLAKGAGIGMGLVYNYCDSLIVGCLPHQATRISVVFPFNLSENQMELIQKSLHVI